MVCIHWPRGEALHCQRSVALFTSVSRCSANYFLKFRDFVFLFDYLTLALTLCPLPLACIQGVCNSQPFLRKVIQLGIEKSDGIEGFYDIIFSNVFTGEEVYRYKKASPSTTVDGVLQSFTGSEEAEKVVRAFGSAVKFVGPENAILSTDVALPLKDVFRDYLATADGTKRRRINGKRSMPQ